MEEKQEQTLEYCDKFEMIGQRIKALGVAAGVFSQTDVQYRDIHELKEIIRIVFYAAGFNDIDWSERFPGHVEHK